MLFYSDIKMFLNLLHCLLGQKLILKLLVHYLNVHVIKHKE